MAPQDAGDGGLSKGVARVAGLRASFNHDLLLHVAELWEGLRRFAVVEQASQADPLFKNGHGTRESRTHRILMPLDCLQTCLQSTASRHVEALRSRAWFAFDLEPRVAESLWRLRGGRASERFRATLVEGGPSDGSETHLRLIGFELGSAWDERVARCLPRHPPWNGNRDAAADAMILAWGALLRADKIRQWEDLQQGQMRLPALPLEWGPVDSLERMPCAVWLHAPRRVCG